jgi:hypothetical protein
MKWRLGKLGKDRGMWVFGITMLLGCAGIFVTFAPPRQAGMAASQTRSDPERMPDPFDITPPRMQPLSVPAPRHRSADEDDLTPLSGGSLEPATADNLRRQTLEFQRRLQSFRKQWKEAESAAREKFFRGTLPVSELESQEHQVDRRFSAAYAQQLADEATQERVKLLQATPGAESHADYEHPKTLQQLQAIEHDFTELRTAYLQKGNVGASQADMSK